MLVKLNSGSNFSDKAFQHISKLLCSGAKITLGIVIAGFVSGCSSGLDPDREYADYYYVGHPAQPPSGILRYCWEEPIVDYESQGPGVREEGRWYYPSAVVVRQVRAGRWRPCETRPDESKGETTSER